MDFMFFKVLRILRYVVLVAPTKHKLYKSSISKVTFLESLFLDMEF